MIKTIIYYNLEPVDLISVEKKISLDLVGNDAY